jgi:hypothetical protein
MLAVKLPMADFMGQRKSVTGLASRMALRIDLSVDRDFPLPEPNGALDFGVGERAFQICRFDPKGQ